MLQYFENGDLFDFAERCLRNEEIAKRRVPVTWGDACGMIKSVKGGCGLGCGVPAEREILRKGGCQFSGEVPAE